jgi:arylsulfatase A-like enzyme
MTPGTHEGIMASDDEGRMIPEAVDAYRRADRLDPFGFSGWVGREPHGASRSDCGTVRDGVFAEQVVELFDELAEARTDGPWLTVASFVNPHDITFAGFGWDQILQFGPPDDAVPSVTEAPSQGDSFAGRPPCQAAFAQAWAQMVYETATDEAYRRLYYHLHHLVDRAIGRILDALERSGMADETVVVLTSDHGDLLGAHGGLIQKWFNAYDEAVRVPLVVAGPGIAAGGPGISVPTSHVDLVPTLLGLAGIDREQAAAGVGADHTEAHPLPGRDLSDLIRGRVDQQSVASPIYFMTEDNVTQGSSQVNILTGVPYDAITGATSVESVVATLPSGADGSAELWKLNRYYERLDEWNADHGIAPNPFLGPAAESLYELHNLTSDPEERTNLADGHPEMLSLMQSVLDVQREAKRLLPSLRNPA